MGLLKEFRDFAMRGNVIDMAVGVIIGAAFGKVVTSVVNDLMTPPISYVSSTLQSATADGVKVPTFDVQAFWNSIAYGKFIGALVDFAIVAFCLFMIIKVINVAKKRFEEQKIEKPAEAPADIKLLTEIRDLLAKQQGDVTKTAV
ncbi:large-conductance mechanosensitive channel protein MscL [Anatilimnocola sp. NA78]|uniref:large-conductance mechanosensitive channel protein MscL n=1 Tax=Anatilimnocola sp. NA78 TaxID=3415683 RepID=UPI003CE5A60A